MARDWHEDFKKWAKPPSETEEQRGSNAASMISDAVRGHPSLTGRSVTIYATGSFRNNTNIRSDSDIDVAVVLNDGFYYDLPSGLTAAQLGFTTPLQYNLDHFRVDVGAALVAKFGRSGVIPGKKTFNITQNTYRLEADATVFLQYRRYTGARTAAGAWEYETGVALQPVGGGTRVVNWHDDHYNHGVARNTATGRRFKRVVRILKRLRNEMAASGSPAAVAAARSASSFLIECLVYNADDQCFGRVEGSYYDDVRAVVARLWHATKPDVNCSHLEVNRKEQLFGTHQAWTQAEAHAFLWEAWQHVGFE